VAQDDARAHAPRRSLVDSAEEALRNWLAPGRHRLGDRLPPENALAAMLGISRGTLRTALRRLEESGEIVRRQGSGTFVGEVGRPAGFREGLEQLESYSSLARRRGVKLGAQDLEIETVALDRDVAARLGVDPGATAARVERVVVADGRPLALMVDTVHPDVPLPTEARLRRAISRGEMVLDVLLGEGVPIAYSMTSIAARLIVPGDAAAASLGVRQATAVLQLDELFHTTSGDVTHHSSDLFAPDGLEPRVVRWLEARRPVQIGHRVRQPQLQG
jgi:DNA-binding GntR family transcriptional regulator